MRFPIFYATFSTFESTRKALVGAKAALDLAAKLDAQLSVAIGALVVSTPNVLASATIAGLVAGENKRSLDAAHSVRDAIDGLAKISGAVVHTEIIAGALAKLTNKMASRARLHGLAVAECGVKGELLHNELIEPLLFGSGRPVLVLPNGYASAFSFDRILIAWDGGLNAARAVWDAMPFLRLAKSIEIVTVLGEKDLGSAPAANALAPMLAFLGAAINVTNLSFDDGTAADLIRGQAAKIGAGLVVQGAYGRSRWAELVLGGVTREMLHESPIPVLMSH